MTRADIMKVVCAVCIAALALLIPAADLGMRDVHPVVREMDICILMGRSATSLCLLRKHGTRLKLGAIRREQHL